MEYIARLACVQRPLRYATSFFGLVDLASVLPMYVAAFVPGLHVLIDIRILRMLRAFRILKLTEYVREYSSLGEALHASRRKILVFLSVVALVVVVLGTVMYVVEGPQHGFTSIPVAIYWAITTMTTVGFGDIAPRTTLGRAVASVVMLLGWGILAVPTGIVTAEMTTRRLSRAGRVTPLPVLRRGRARGRRTVLPSLRNAARLALRRAVPRAQAAGATGEWRWCESCGCLDGVWSWPSASRSASQRSRRRAPRAPVSRPRARPERSRPRSRP